MEKTFHKRTRGQGRYAVAFRAHERTREGCPNARATAQWIEVTVVAPTRSEATQRAKEILSPVTGLTFEGTS